MQRGDNLHYLWQQKYEDLPAFLAGWDVALLPFARNDATRLTSPTKTLECMAAGKPVVSTPLADMADRPYGDIVGLVATADEFAAARGRPRRDGRRPGVRMDRYPVP